jgi:hypothetical protein
MFEFLVFEHHIPISLIVTGLAVAVGSAVFSFLRFLPGDWRNLFLFVIRMAFLALLGWCLLLPQLRHSMTETIKPRFLVAVDTSASMKVLPSKNLTTNRWMVAQDVLRQPWVKRLTAECAVDVFPFDRELGAPMSPAQVLDLAPQGQSSLLRDSLRKMLERYRGQNVAGVLLLSDGLDTREVHDDWARESWPCPIYTVRLEPQVEWDGEPDVHVDSIDTPRRVVVSWDTKLTAVVSGQGIKGEAFNVQLFKDGELIQEVPTQHPAEGGSREVSFRLEHPLVGNFIYTVKVPPLPRETQTNDNVFAVNVQVVDSKNRVLYLEGVPRWESKYLVRALKANKTITPLAFIQGPNKKFITFGERGSMTLEVTEQQLGLYKIVVLGDLKGEVLGEERAAALLKFVENGGSLMLLGGANAWGAEGFQTTALRRLLPFTRPWSEAIQEGQFEVKLTDEGRSHAVFARGTNNLQKLPPVLSLIGGARLSAGAVSLVDAHTPAGDQPVLVAQKFGQGKVAAVLTDSLWKWQLNAGEESPPYNRFWNQILEWLSPSETEVDKFEIDLFADVDQLYLDEAIQLKARVSAANDELPSSLKVICELQKPDQRKLSLDMAAQTVTAASGKTYPGFGVEFRAEAPGLYKAVARTEIKDQKVESAPYSFFIKAFTPETAPKPINTALLQLLAEQSEGRFLDPSEVSRVLSDLKITTREEERIEYQSLWHSWWVIACLMSLLSLEWIIRKVRNMA